MEGINKYVNDIQSISNSSNSFALSEHSYRTAFENYLSSIVREKNIDVQIFQELKVISDQQVSIPDFSCISKRNLTTLGYIETKNLNYPIDNYIENDQIKKYQRLCDNILLTNYTQFIWITSDFQRTATINHQNEVDNLIKEFLEVSPPRIRKVKDLSYQIAYYSRKFKDILFEELKKEYLKDHPSVLQGVFKQFQNTLVRLNYSDFSDAFAQMTAFGFMLAKLNKPDTTITLENVRNAIPKPYGLIKELLRFVDDELLNMDDQDRMRFYVKQLIGIMNAMDVETIERQLFTRKSKSVNLFGETQTRYVDPFIYFYEDFLAEYDKGVRKDRGVYYTPPQIVQLIVKFIDNTLTENFNRKKGIGEQDVTALDFACGTGTFIVEYASQLLNKFDNQSLQQKAIKDRLLKNLKGFEILAGAYTVAILKLSQFLKKNYGYNIDEKDSIQIKLTNTLEDEPVKYDPIFPFFSQESEDANKIKEENVLVIMGNPPYSKKSQNKSLKILNLLSDYKNGLQEKKINLDDDYIKFIRFAHHKISTQQQGVVGIITSNSYLLGIGHRVMREMIIKDFDCIYIIDLHGDSKKDIDKNIFSITVGVCISIFVKLPERAEQKKISYFSTKSNNILTKQQKLDFAENITFKLQEASIETVLPWQSFTPIYPYYFFVPKDFSDEGDYQKFWSLKDIFQVKNTGVQTKRDKFTIKNTRSELLGVINDLRTLTVDVVREKYNLKDGRDWTLAKAKQSVLTFDEQKVVEICNRPFNTKWSYLNEKSKGFMAYPRFDIMKHFMLEGNIGLITTRNTRSNESWKHAFVSDKIINGTSTISTLDNAYLFPLYIYVNSVTNSVSKSEKVANFTKNFSQYIKDRYINLFTAEQIMGYIYGIMYSPLFRENYNESLKIDFAKIPFVDELHFDLISILGTELINLHLFKIIPIVNVSKWMGSHYKVTKIYWQNNKLYISNNQYFDSVSEGVYNYVIGGYQVLYKLLQEKLDSELSLDDIEHIENVVSILSRTIEIENELLKLPIENE